jgi:hypothetical protein
MPLVKDLRKTQGTLTGSEQFPNVRMGGIFRIHKFFASEASE